MIFPDASPHGVLLGFVREKVYSNQLNEFVGMHPVSSITEHISMRRYVRKIASPPKIGRKLSEFFFHSITKAALGFCIALQNKFWMLCVNFLQCYVNPKLFIEPKISCCPRSTVTFLKRAVAEAVLGFMTQLQRASPSNTSLQQLQKLQKKRSTLKFSDS